MARPEEQPRYWFGSKQFGWGWGLPLTWEGWVVFTGYLAGIIALALLAAENQRLLFGGIIVLSLLLVGICALKGEPPRWRWGRDDR